MSLAKKMMAGFLFLFIMLSSGCTGVRAPSPGRIVFVEVDAEGNQFLIAVDPFGENREILADEDEAIRLAPGAGPFAPIHSSPSGDILMFAVGDAVDQKVFCLDLDAGESYIADLSQGFSTLSPDGKWLLLGDGRRERVYIRSACSGEREWETLRVGAVQSAVFSDDGEKALLAVRDGENTRTVYLHLGSQTSETLATTPGLSAIWQLASFVPGSDEILLFDEEWVFKSLEASSQVPVVFGDTYIQIHAVSAQDFVGVAERPDGRFQLDWLDQRGFVMHSLITRATALRLIPFPTPGRILVVASYQGGNDVFIIENEGQTLIELAAVRQVRDVIISSDGKWVAVLGDIGGDFSGLVVSMDTGEEHWLGLAAEMRSLSFEPGGDRVVYNYLKDGEIFLVVDTLSDNTAALQLSESGYSPIWLP